MLRTSLKGCLLIYLENEALDTIFEIDDALIAKKEGINAIINSLYLLFEKYSLNTKFQALANIWNFSKTMKNIFTKRFKRIKKKQRTIQGLTLRVLIFAGVYFREQKKLYFASINFREWVQTENFACINFREIQKNKIFHNW